MIVTLRGFARTYSSQSTNGALGANRSSSGLWSYEKTAIWAIIVLCFIVGVLGVGTLLYAVICESTLLMVFGMILTIASVYQLLVTVKEKANLDLLSAHFGNLSESARTEIIQTVAKANSAASNGLLNLIESLFDRSKP